MIDGSLICQLPTGPYMFSFPWYFIDFALNLQLNLETKTCLSGLDGGLYGGGRVLLTVTENSCLSGLDGGLYGGGRVLLTVIEHSCFSGLDGSLYGGGRVLLLRPAAVGPGGEALPGGLLVLDHNLGSAPLLPT